MSNSLESSTEKKASEESQKNVTDSQANGFRMSVSELEIKSSEIPNSGGYSAKKKGSEESQNNVIDSQANGFRKSDKEPEIESSKMLKSNESATDKKASEETQNNVVDLQTNAIRTFYSNRGHDALPKFWMRSSVRYPLQHTGTGYSPSTVNQYEPSLTEFPQYGVRKNIEYKKNIEKSNKTDMPYSKPALAQETSLPNKQGTQSNSDSKIENGKTNNSKIAEGFKPESLDNSSRFLCPLKMDRRSSHYARSEIDSNIDLTSSLERNTSDLSSQESSTSDLTTSQESSTSDLTISQRSSTSELKSSQNFDLSDMPRSNISTTNVEEEAQRNNVAPNQDDYVSKESNVPDKSQVDNNLSQNITGAIKKSRVNIDTETELMEYKSEGLDLADENDEDESISSCNTIRPPEMEEDPYNLSDHTLKVFSDEENNSDADDFKDTLNSKSAEILNVGASNSGISSGVTSETNIDESTFDEEFSPSEGAYGNKISHFTMTLHNKIRSMKTLLAAQAFKNLAVFDVDLPLELRRTYDKRARIQVENESLTHNNNGMDNKRSQKQLEPDSTFFQSIPSDPQHNVTASLPRLHNGVATIERLEDILEMLLTIGYKTSNSSQDLFGNQQVPSAIHNAMCDVKTFLEPIKAYIETSVQDEYMRPLMDSVQDAITPIFHHLNDSIIALESPATPINYLSLKFVSNPSYDMPPSISEVSEEITCDTVEEIYEMAAYDHSIMNQEMFTFDQSIGFRTPLSRPGIHRPHVVPLGLIEIPFLHNMLVIITLDLGIIVVNKAENIVATISADGYLAGLKFRYGECLQTGTCIDASFYNIYDELEKRAKISPKGITFQDEYSPTTYLITTASITTCQGIHSNLTDDFLGRILYSGSRFGPQHIPDCIDLLKFAKSSYDDDGTVTWIIQNLKIKQNPDGQIILHKNSAEYTIIMTPNRDDGENEWIHAARLTTPEMHITCSMTEKNKGNKHHLYIRQADTKIFCSEQKFIVRNYNQTAGIDREHKIYLNAS